MAKLVSRSTIKLGNSASAVDSYYNNYSITLKRVDSVTGKETTQKKTIIGYSGNTKIATIDGLWDIDFIPKPTDTYEITPQYPDSRVSINPAIQTLDYISSKRYGKGLDPHKDLYLPSWLESARLCDTRSDVTVRTIVDVSPTAIGSVYEYRTASLHFQGKISSITGKYVKFTDCIGKVCNKWNSWKVYIAGSLVYEGSRTWKKTATGTAPVSPLINPAGFEEVNTSIGFTKVSGAGPTTIQVKTDGNLARAVNSKGVEISGYSLYDSDGIDYWRYLGWDQHEQRSVTRHQSNVTVDTSQTLFDNTNGLLEHFGGILRYSGGKYHLEVESGEGNIPSSDNEPRNITDDVTIGKIRITDEGMKGSFNSLTVAYADPANKYEAKNISFFNSDFLKADRNVPKKGSVSIPGITNYYNARLLADKFLAKSRYGLVISFNMAPRGLLLFSGRVIQVQNARYGWVNKKFRIESLTHNTDTTVDVVASEYDDSMYVINNLSRPPASALAAEANIITNSEPGGLTTTSIDSQDETVGGIELSWDNTPKTGYSTSTEIYGGRLRNLFLNPTSISGGDTFTTPLPHGLVVGDWITSYSNDYGLEFKKSYYIKERPTASTFKLSETPSDLPLNHFINGSGLTQLGFMTASIVTTVEYPGDSYIDVIPGQGSARIEKFYWIRHKFQG